MLRPRLVRVRARVRVRVTLRVSGAAPPPEWSKAVKSAALEAASSSTRGSGWALGGPASCWECRAAQNRQARPEEAQEPSFGTAKEHRSRAWALPRGYFDPAAPPTVRDRGVRAHPCTPG
eukprot:scaffold10832_cov45-Phaeocystis_antarctica.AAC.5